MVGIDRPAWRAMVSAAVATELSESRSLFIETVFWTPMKVGVARARRVPSTTRVTTSSRSVNALFVLWRVRRAAKRLYMAIRTVLVVLDKATGRGLGKCCEIFVFLFLAFWLRGCVLGLGEWVGYLFEL